MPQGKTPQNNFNQRNTSLRPNDNFSLKRAMQPTYNPYIQPTEPKKQFISKIEQDVLQKIQPIKNQLLGTTSDRISEELKQDPFPLTTDLRKPTDVGQIQNTNITETPQPVDNIAKNTQSRYFVDTGYDIPLDQAYEQKYNDFIQKGGNYKEWVEKQRLDRIAALRPEQRGTGKPNNPTMKFF